MQAIDPTSTYNFVVKIQNTTVGWFTACSGLALERKVTPQREGGVNDYEHHLPGPVSYSKLTLKRGLADNALWEWFRQGLYDGKVERRDVTIVLLNPDRTEARRWTMPNAIPLRWGGLDFQSDSNQVNVETLEIGAGSEAEAGVVQRALTDEPGAANPAAEPETDIDVSALAEQVYALLKDDLRVEQQRLGRKWS